MTSIRNNGDVDVTFTTCLLNACTSNLMTGPHRSMSNLMLTRAP